MPKLSNVLSDMRINAEERVARTARLVDRADLLHNEALTHLRELEDVASSFTDDLMNTSPPTGESLFDLDS